MLRSLCMLKMVAWKCMIKTHNSSRIFKMMIVVAGNPKRRSRKRIICPEFFRIPCRALGTAPLLTSFQSDHHVLLCDDRWKTEMHNDLSLIQRSYLITICPIELQLISFMISEDAPIFILNVLFRINQFVSMSLCYYAVASQENMGATCCCCFFPHIVFIMVF